MELINISHLIQKLTSCANADLELFKKGGKDISDAFSVF